MKHLTICALLILPSLCFSQPVELATAISAEDLGAYKWNFSAGIAPENSVVIFRVTTVQEWPNGKVTTDVDEKLYYSPGRERTGTAFFINPHYFDNKEEEPTWHFRVFGRTGSIAGQHAGHSIGEKEGEIHFKSEKWGETTMRIECIIKSYDEAALLYDDLPPISQYGSWGGYYTKKAGADQPATAPESQSEGNSKPKPESEVRSQ